MKCKEKKEPFWKRRILTDISRLRKDLRKTEAWFAGRWKKDKKKEKDWLDQKNGLKGKGFTLVIEKLKQRITAKATKVKRYGNRIKQFRDNKNFKTNQGRFFKNLAGKDERTKPPNAEDATAFWKGIWSTKVEHKRDAEWIDKANKKMPSEKQNTVKITKDDIKRKRKSMPDWKGTGPEVQKGSRRKCQGMKDQLDIDRYILQNCRKRKTNLSMAKADYKKAYDMVPHSWIITTIEMVGFADNFIGLIKQSMNKWKANLDADGKLLGSVTIRRGIFPGDWFSPLLFVIALLPLTDILRETGMENGTNVNHLFFMGDLKLYGKERKRNRLLD